MSNIEIKDPKLIIRVVDTITVHAKCNDCNSDNIAVIIERIPQYERENVVG